MNIVKQVSIIFAFAYAGEILARFIPVGLPASITGLLLMIAALGFKVLKPEHISTTADFLTGIMAFFFLPAAATIIENFDVIMPALWKLLVVVFACTFFTFFATYGTVRLLRRLLERKK